MWLYQLYVFLLQSSFWKLPLDYIFGPQLFTSVWLRLYFISNKFEMVGVKFGDLTI